MGRNVQCSNSGTGKRFFFLQDVYTSSGALPVSYSVGIVVPPGVKRPMVSQRSFNLHLAPRLRTSGATCLFSLYTLRAWTRKLFSFHLYI
jgi:hypothetical protein